MDISKQIERITVLKADGETVDVFTRKQKHSKRLSSIEKLVRRATRARIAGLQQYSDRHQASNGKKKDGWLKDLRKNASKATSKSWKILRD